MEKFDTNNIRLNAEGVWFHEGIEITHERTIEMLFKSVLAKSGKYFLSGEKKPVPFVVDDVAFFVRSILEKKDGFVIKLSDYTQESLDVSTLDVASDNQLYCFIKSGSVKAKFERKVYYELMKKLDQRDGYFGLVINGKFYPLCPLASGTRLPGSKPRSLLQNFESRACLGIQTGDPVQLASQVQKNKVKPGPTRSKKSAKKIKAKRRKRRKRN
jgi:hypothetical protein